MSIRNWVVGKLARDYTVSDYTDSSAVLVERGARPPAVICCVEPDRLVPFTVTDLEDLLVEAPECQFVVLTRRRAVSRVYEVAAELGVYVGSFGDLRSALETEDDVSRYTDREQTYVRTRIGRNRHVANLERCGKTAYRIVRRGGLRPLIVVTTDQYELTADAVYQLLDEHEDLAPDAIVVTNPNCRGFAPTIVAVQANTEVASYLMQDFLDSLAESWE